MRLRLPFAPLIPIIAVVCGVLRRADGAVLIAQRPAGKIAPGKWEFPGGKIEPGESPWQALARELHEELGIDPDTARPLIRFVHAYTDRVVHLDTWLVTAWRGAPQGREAQRFEWCAPSRAAHLDLLPTVAPILHALQLPEDYVFTAPDADERHIREGLPQLPTGALLRLRLPRLDDAAYRRLARSIRPDADTAGLRLVLDRTAQEALALGASGWHASHSTLLAGGSAPMPGLLRLASCHDARSLAAAQAQGFDAAVLGPVQATPTHPGATALGWNGFEALAPGTPLPVYAIGGLGSADKDAAFARRAQGVAGISAYWRHSPS